MKLSLKSPAKINLFLHVIGRRKDGYHELASLFQAVSLFDHLQFSLDSETRLCCDDPNIPTDSSNLIVQAACLFQRKTGLRQGLRIELTKKIPVHSGLGGGSSNAATTLWAYNQLLGSPVEEQMLQRWAAEIGSDIPFFFSSGSAYCTGRGERVESLKPLLKQSGWIVKPPFGISTKLLYNTLDIADLSPKDPKCSLKRYFEGNPHFFNDLEEAAFKLRPSLLFCKQQLQCAFSDVLMTGSGSALFCLGDSRPKSPLKGTKCFPFSFVRRDQKNWY